MKEWNNGSRVMQTKLVLMDLIAALPLPSKNASPTVPSVAQQTWQNILNMELN